MLLTITTTHRPATDLGYLLHKHPDRVQLFDLSFARAHVFYPEASEERCTAALLLDIDPIALRRRHANSNFALGQYVNDRPYAASSLTSVAIARLFRSALAGISEERPELVERPIPLRARISALPCRGGEQLLRDLFEPLGYRVTAEGGLLDEVFPEWGTSPYYAVAFEGEVCLKDLLSHLYVLIPVLDNEKHYYVGEEEIDKLLRHGEGWLAAHPQRDLIAERYLKHQRGLQREALERLMVEEGGDADETVARGDVEESTLEAEISLNQRRLEGVAAALRESGARRVLDLGCGEGRLLQELVRDPQFSEIVGMDVSHRVLERAARRLRLERVAAETQPRLRLIQGSLLYRDVRLEGYEAAALVEVIEHLDPPRLAASERVVFECARPGMVVVTTPNADYNARWETLPAGEFRHRDHRFEWGREQFRAWGNGIGERFGYQVRFASIGPEDVEVGPPTQMGIFTARGV
jgi:3' terminal RNA ribose 2'-O-methyltransferase Hen1